MTDKTRELLAKMCPYDNMVKYNDGWLFYKNGQVIGGESERWIRPLFVEDEDVVKRFIDSDRPAEIWAEFMGLTI